MSNVFHRIAIVIERTDPSLGGAERSVAELSEALRSAGLDVTLLAAQGKPTETTKILCGRNRGARISMARFEKALIRHLAENDYDIVHSTLPFSFCDVYQPRGGSYHEAMIRNAASYDHPRIAFVKRWTGVLNWRRTVLQMAERKLCRQSEGPVIAALSEYVREQFLRHYAVPEDRIAVIANGVTVGSEVSTERILAFRTLVNERLGVPGETDAALFLFAANNFRLKGLSPLIHALQRTLSWPTARPIQIAIAGAGGRGRYLRLAQKLGVADQITFLGVVSDMPAAIAACDAAVLPTFYDPSSRFILEALSLHRPVITTRFNGASEMFEHQRHGVILKDPRDIETLAAALVRYSDPDLVRKVSQAIRNDPVCRAVSIDRHAAQLLSLYDRIFHGIKRC